MKNSVKVTAHPETKAIYTPNKELGKDGKEYGFYRVQQDILRIRDGFASVESRSALVTVEKEQFNKMNALGLLKDGTEMEGKIIYKDSLEQKPGYSPLINPSNNTQMTSNGSPIYRTSVFTEDMSASDELLPKDKIVSTAPVKTNSAAEKVEKSL